MIKNLGSADKVTGHLLFNYALNTFVFRVYADGTFIDYDIKHSDLVVTIDDKDANFYQNCERSFIDHSPETLGKV